MGDDWNGRVSKQYAEEICRQHTELETENAGLRAENERLRAALNSVDEYLMALGLSIRSPIRQNIHCTLAIQGQRPV